MATIEKQLIGLYQLNSVSQLYELLRQQFGQIDFNDLSRKLKIQKYSIQQFVTSFLKSQRVEQPQLQNSEKEDLFLYIACLLKLKLFTFAETVEFFIPRTLNRFTPQSLRQSFYNFKKNKKMTQLQVFLNYNFVDLQQLFMQNPDQQKLQFEVFFSDWCQYLQGDNFILQRLCPEVFRILSGEIQVQIPTAIQQLNEETKFCSNTDIVKLEKEINNILQRKMAMSKNFDSPVALKPKKREFKPLPTKRKDATGFTFPSQNQGTIGFQPPIVESRQFQTVQPGQVVQVGKQMGSQLGSYLPQSVAQSATQTNRRVHPHSAIDLQSNQVARIFSQLSQQTIPNPPAINLQHFTHTNNYSTMTDIQSLSLLNGSNISNNSLLQNDFRSVINDNQNRAEESDAQQNLVHALGGMDEVSMCLMQLGIHEKSESRQGGEQ